MDLDKNKGILPPTDFAPWAVDTTFGPGFTYSPRTRTDDDFYVSGTQAAWSALEAYSQAPISAPLQSSLSYFTGDGLVSQEPWTFETDSESGDISPVEGRYPAPELDAAPANPRWSWSQPSSPPFDMGSAPGHLPAVANYTLKGSSPGPNGAASTQVKANNAKTTPKLRTASRKPRKSPARRGSRGAITPSEPDSNAADDVTPEELRARRNHNLVEKQYRNRLNAQFERLLSVLPSEQQRQTGYSGDGFGGGGGGGGSGGGDDEGTTGGVGDDKRMSKAEVLDVATRRIKELEMERRQLQRERRELQQNMEVMSAALSRSNVQR